MNRPLRKTPLLRRFMSWILSHLQQLNLSLAELWRTPMTTMMTLLVMGFSLSLPTLFLILAGNVSQLQNHWNQAAEINVYLKPNVSEAQQQDVLNQLQAMPSIATVEYVSPEQGLTYFNEQTTFGDALTLFDSNPLPALFIVQPNMDIQEVESVRKLQATLTDIPMVALARLDIDWLQRLDAILLMLQKVGLTFVLLLIIAVILTSANSIRLDIMQRSEEIKVMKFVGATNAFIRRPFLYHGLWLGLLSALIGLVLVNTILLWLDRAMLDLLGLYQSQFQIIGLSWSQSGYFVLVSGLLAWFGAWISVYRHLRTIEPS